MKVLFAVQDEQISTKIVKEYQKKYKEIISYKNIYYFSAILKELQRDKTYDRIVVDEELEELNNTSYEQRDKFIFDKLDNISDEAMNLKGQDIPIILICSERRSKGEDIFVKLFGLGIYNAIIGNDRSTEVVCNLIERPRSKKQAKMYYKIDSEEVKYIHENENDVSEEEMKNILTHFKRLGKNEDLYVDSFSKIIKQYNAEQIKIIIKILPLNVKAVLEEKSPEYQKLISVNGSIKVKREEVEESKGTFEKLLVTNNNEQRISKPVVVPTIMKNNTVKKLKVNKPIVNYDIKDEELEVENLNELEEDELENNTEMSKVTSDISENTEVTTQKRRGRPRKNPELKPIESKEDVVPKKRGRPRKVTNTEEIENRKTEEDFLELEEIQELPGFDEEYEEETPSLPGFDEEYEEETPSLPGFDEEYEEDTPSLPGFGEEYEEDTPELPGFDEEYEEETPSLPGFDEEYEEETSSLPGFDEEYEEDTQVLSDFDGNYNEKTIMESEIKQYNPNKDRANAISEVNIEDDDYGDFENLLSSDKKVVAFVGTSKNGTSFIVNNVAQYLSMKGIDVAILDTTQNKNSYYIYTKNEEQLRNIASNSIKDLIRGNANGITVNRNLSVYTSVPNQDEGIENVKYILETLVKKHSVVLIDCDFNTPLGYFDKVQEIYLVQSMDVLTIQPLTAFLRELKSRNIINQNKIKILINKSIKLRGITIKNIIGGVAFYNDPEMSFMTELFDKDTVKYLEIPFDEEVYAIYLEGIIECEININRYPKKIELILEELANMVYPLLPNTNNEKSANRKRGYEYSSGFSSSVNNTLNNMKRRY